MRGDSEHRSAVRRIRSLRPAAGDLARFGALCALAALVSLLVSYRVTLDPLAVTPREVQFSAAKAELLVDTPSSQLGDQRQDPHLGQIAHLSVMYALFLKSDLAERVAADAAGIPGREIAASGPFNLLIGRTNFAPQGPQIPSSQTVDSDYRLVVDVDGREPLLRLYSQAPTTRQAVAIVDSMRSLLIRYVAGQEKRYPLPATFRGVVRPLGQTTGGVVDPGARAELEGFIFCLVLGLGGSLMLALRRRRRRPRSALALGRLEPSGAADDDWPHTRRLLPWTLAAFVAMIFLVPIDAISLPVHLPLNSKPDRAFLVAIALLWVSTLAIASGAARPRLQLTKAHVAIVLFVVACLASVALNWHALSVDQEVVPVIKKLALLISFVAFFVIAASVLRPREVPRFIELLVALGVILAICTLIERAFKYDPFYALWGKLLPVSPPADLDKIDTIGRLAVDGPTSEPLELVALLSIVLPFGIVGAIDARGWRPRLLYALASTLLLGAALATGRKTGVVAPAAGLLVLIGYRPRTMLKGIAVSALPLLVAIHIMAPGQIGTSVSDLLPGQSTNALTTKDREARYDAIRPDVMSHLLIGRGFQSYDPVKYRILDNELLGLTIGVGAIGLVAYLGIFGVLFALAHPMIRGPDPRRSAAALAIQSALVTTLVANALFDELSFVHVSYMLFLLAAMVVALRAPTAVRSTARAPAALDGLDWPAGREPHGVAARQSLSGARR